MAGYTGGRVPVENDPYRAFVASIDNRPCRDINSARWLEATDILRGKASSSLRQR